MRSPSDDRGPAPLFDLAFAGKSLLILGGAFLLRAATESATLPRHVGVTLGLLYAASWIAGAAFVARTGFNAAAAAVVAYPIVWEATTHFNVLNAAAAAIILVLFSGGLMFVARRTSMAWLAWIAAAGATFDSTLLAWATRDVAPFLLAMGVLTLIAVGQTKWLLAVESDLFAIVLIVMTLLNEKQPSPVIWLLVFAAFSLIRTGYHSIGGAAVGFGGATAIVLMRGLTPTPIALAELAAAAIAYVVAIRRESLPYAIIGSIAAASGSMLLLPHPPARAIAWGIAAVATAEIARRRSAFAYQSPVWAALSAAASPGIAAPFCFIAFLRGRNIVLLALAALGTLVTVDALLPSTQPTHALMRTIVLAIASLLLAVAGRQWRIREASQLAMVALVVTGVQIAAEEMRSGAAAMMFVALAVYGGAMLGMARLRRVGVR